MANNVQGKLPTSKNVVYDSGNDTPTERKRAVEVDAPLSVAERARLFGTQIKVSTASKNPKPQQPPLYNQLKKPNIVPQERNFQSPETDVDRFPKKPTIVSQERNYQPLKTDVDRYPEKPNIVPQGRNYQPLKTDVDRYPEKLNIVPQGRNYQPLKTDVNRFPKKPNIVHQERNFQPPETEADRYPKKPNIVSQGRNYQPFKTDADRYSKKPNIVPQGRNYQPFKTDVDRHSEEVAYYSTPQNVPSNYRSPVQIDDRPKSEQSLLTDSHHYSTVTRSHNYNQYQPTQQVPNTVNYPPIIPSEPYASNDGRYFDAYDRQKPSHNTSYFQPIQDPLEALYKDTSQRYSQQQIPRTIDNDVQAFDLGNLINRIQADYLNHARPYVSSIQFIESEPSLDNIGIITSATNRKDYTRRSDDIYHRQAPSYSYDVIDTNGIHPNYSKPPFSNTYQSSIKREKRGRRHNDQESSPIHVSESTTTTKKQYQPERPPASPIQKVPTPVPDSSSEEEEEEMTPTVTQAEVSKTTESGASSEDETTTEDPISEPPIEVTHPPIITETPATPRNEITRSAVPNQTPAKPNESESSESEESDSDSDSESETDDDVIKPAPAAAPTPIMRSNLPRATPVTPQMTVRATPQRTTTDNRNTIQPPEPSRVVNSIDLQSTKKSSKFGSKVKSIANVFRRSKKS